MSRCGNARQLQCSCCSVFEMSTVSCAVAAYLMHYGRFDKLTKQLILIDWIKSATVSDEVAGSLPYRIPYLPFSEYEDRRTIIDDFQSKQSTGSRNNELFGWEGNSESSRVIFGAT